MATGSIITVPALKELFLILAVETCDDFKLKNKTS